MTQLFSSCVDLSDMCFVLQLEIKNHIFFSPINWDDLYHKRLAPPYNPNVVGNVSAAQLR